MPQAVMKTAAIPVNASKTWYLWWTLDDISAQSYVYMHFAEIQTLKASDIREFNITYNGGLRWYSYMRPPKLSISTIFNPGAVSSSDGVFNFTFTMTGNSTLPPLINALEIYTVVDVTQLGTDNDEGKHVLIRPFCKLSCLSFNRFLVSEMSLNYVMISFCYDEHQEDIWFKQEVKLARRSMCSSVVSVGRCELQLSGLRAIADHILVCSIFFITKVL